MTQEFVLLLLDLICKRRQKVWIYNAGYMHPSHKGYLTRHFDNKLTIDRVYRLRHPDSGATVFYVKPEEIITISTVNTPNYKEQVVIYIVVVGKGD